MVDFFIERRSRLDIGGDEIERHGIFVERLTVKGVEGVGHLVIAELRTEHVACFEQRTERAVARVAAKPLVVAQRTSGLTGFVVAAERRACRHADKRRKFDAVFHQNVDHTGGEQAAHGAALEHKSGILIIHRYHLFHTIN